MVSILTALNDNISYASAVTVKTVHFIGTNPTYFLYVSKKSI
jgi:hypothetical protein